MHAPLLGLPWVAEVGRALRSAPNDDEAASLAWASEPGAVAALAGREFTSRVLAPLAGRVERAGMLGRLPEDARAILGAARAWGEQKREVVRGLLAPLGDACRAEGLKPVLLKGAAHHGVLYPDPADRPCGDVDVLVAARDARRFHDLLLRVGCHPENPARTALAMGGASRPEPWQLDLVYLAPEWDHVLELKADPIAIGPPIRGLEALAEPGDPSPVYPGFFLPRPDVRVLLQALHLVRRKGPDLLAHVELARTLDLVRDRIDPPALVARVSGDGLDGLVRRVLADTEAAFPGAVPGALLARSPNATSLLTPALRRGTLAPRRETGAWRRAAVCLPRVVGGGRPGLSVRWFLGRVFPPEPLLSALAVPGVGSAALRVPRRVVSFLRGRHP